MKLTAAFRALSEFLATLARISQSALLLALRLWWGWSFLLTGRGKLLHLDRTAEYFASLGIPFAKLNALTAGSVEVTGGILLMLGLATRFASLPLMFTLAVAYATAERDAVRAIFRQPDQFTGAAPFLFLLAVVIVFAFGPGRFSLDHMWLERRRNARMTEHQTEIVANAARSQA